MKTCLITTTVNVPHVLALYRAYDPDVFFLIAGDRKTPDVDVVNFLHDIPNHAYYGIDHQYKLGYKCARLIPENCIQRRNIMLLEALRMGFDRVISIDDDNIPMSPLYFYDFQRIFDDPFNGLAHAGGGWFDVGRWQFTRDGRTVCQRGIPQHAALYEEVGFVTDARVGVAQGLCIGDPDTSAIDRISQHPTIHHVSDLLRAGIVVDPRWARTIWNSQNTAIIRELIPAWFMLPFCDRYDDVIASLICQRVMRERGLVAHFGSPVCWQSRNQHDLRKDLQAEMWGMNQIDAIVARLDDVELPAGSVVEQTRAIFQALADPQVLLSPTLEAAFAWLEDCEKVLEGA